MKIGVRAHDYGCKEPEKLAETLCNAGFEACQLALTKAIAGINSLNDVTPEKLEQIESAFLNYNVEISVLGCYVEIGLPNRDDRLSEVDKFLTGLDYAKELGVNLIGTETTYFNISSMEGKLSREETYQNMKDSVLKMIEKAERIGVNVGIETVADHTLHSAEMTRRLLDEVGSKRLHVIFDPVNLILSQQDIERQDEIFSEFIDVVGKDISVLHVKDVVVEDGEKVWRNIGQGDINYAPVIKSLKALPKEIPALREHVRPESANIDIRALKKLTKQ